MRVVRRRQRARDARFGRRRRVAARARVDGRSGGDDLVRAAEQRIVDDRTTYDRARDDELDQRIAVPRQASVHEPMAVDDLGQPSVVPFVGSVLVVPFVGSGLSILAARSRAVACHR